MNNKTTICDQGCLYKTKGNPCMVLTVKGIEQAKNRNTCGLFNDASKPNKAKCK